MKMKRTDPAWGAYRVRTTRSSVSFSQGSPADGVTGASPENCGHIQSVPWCRTEFKSARGKNRFFLSVDVLHDTGVQGVKNGEALIR
jgi:hypothetical protein